MVCKYFLPKFASFFSFHSVVFNRLPWLPFHFADKFLCFAEVFYFDVVPLIYFYFCAFGFGLTLLYMSLCLLFCCLLISVIPTSVSLNIPYMFIILCLLIAISEVQYLQTVACSVLLSICHL